VPRNLGSLHRVAVAERNLRMTAIAAAGAETRTLRIVVMRATKGILGTISQLPERGTLGTTVAEAVQHSLHPGTAVAVIVATNNHHKQLMATNTIIAANNRHNHIQLSSAGRMAWVAQRAPCGLAFQQNQTRGCALRHSLVCQEGCIRDAAADRSDICPTH
jgi:hypothetical protein